MPELVRVYQLINDAERETQKGSYRKARDTYEKILEYVLNDDGSDTTLDKRKIGTQVYKAVELLIDDIRLRIRELNTLITIRNMDKTPSTDTENSSDTNNNKNGESPNSEVVNKRKNFNMLNTVILNNGSIINPNESLWNINTNGVISDPSLINVLNKFQSNLVDSISRQLSNDIGPGGKLNNDIHINTEWINCLVSKSMDEEMVTFEKELCHYENKKCKEFQIKLDHSNEENKKLNNQMNKLRERWDSLVESAKQKRLRKQEDNI